MRARIEEQVISISVSVKIRNPHQAPRRRDTWPKSPSDKHIVVQVQNRRLAGARIENDEIGLQVMLKSPVATSAQPLGSLGPEALPINVTPLRPERYQIAVWRVMALNSA